MSPRPETHGFTRFVLSMGAFLCVAAFLAPSLILRDINVLTVSEQELRGLTPGSEDEIRSRQNTAHILGTAAPYFSLALLVGGVALIAYGLPRLRRQEHKDDEKNEAEFAQLLNALKPQSEEEQQSELESEVAEAAESVKPVSTAPPSPQVDPHRKRIDRAREVETRVLARLEEIAPPVYELKPRVKVPGEPRLLVDGILLSRIEQAPDMLVEIKVGDARATMNFRNRLADTLLRLTSYRNRLDRNSVGWLILVLDGEVTEQVRARLIRLSSDMEEQIHVSIIKAEEIAVLRLPSA